MPPTIKYHGNYPEKVGNITFIRHLFAFQYAESDDEPLYFFTTGGDCKELKLDPAIGNPINWIHIGIAILTNMSYIKSEVKKHKKELRGN